MLVIYWKKQQQKQTRKSHPFRLEGQGMDQKLWMACVIPFPRVPNRYQKINEVLSVSSSIKHPPHARIFSK